MPGVTYIEFNGAAYTVEVAVGTTLIRGAVDNKLPGIDADCGGECACATFHVYVDAAWLDKTSLPEPGQEATMLGFAAAAPPNSRLSCRIKMREDLAGIVLQMPEGQH
jgi:ferredoxin, 2Fe-2S